MTVHMQGGGPRHAVTGGVGVLLPADWWVVLLADPEGRRRAVSDLVARQFGKADASAGVRREVRVGLASLVERAAVSGGWVLAVMLTHAGPVPLPATLTGYRVGGSFADEAGIAQVRNAMTVHVAGAASGRVDLGEGPFGVVVRGARERTGPSSLGGADDHVLVCDYWTDPGDGQGLVNLSFSTPMTMMRDGFIDLFDAIAGTLYRVDTDDGTDDPVQDDLGPSLIEVT